MPTLLPQPLHGPSRRVLVVEDHEDCLGTMVDLLSALGCNVRGARTGEDALLQAAAFRPDVVLLDLGLPGISGHEVAQELRSDPRTRDVLIVAVTGHGMPGERIRSIEAGIDQHLVKPVEMHQLIELVFATAQHSRQRSRHTVLVVDDNPAGRYATARGLASVGFQVLEAQSGMQALEMARRATAMVLDVCLPDLDGREVCRMLRGQSSTAALPIVHHSAVYVSEADAAQARQAGADAYIVSPVYSGVLANLLDSLIARG
jgi:CheY-like chemotaxis protein